MSIPRDRYSSFDLQSLAKYQRRFPSFHDKIIAMYARGMSTREIVGHIQELHGIDVLPDLILAVTDAVLEEIGIWQARPLELVYPLVFFDALRVKIRDKGLVRNKTVQVALGVTAEPISRAFDPWFFTIPKTRAGKAPWDHGAVCKRSKGRQNVSDRQREDTFCLAQLFQSRWQVLLQGWDNPSR